jgi:hypothetical protein
MPANIQQEAWKSRETFASVLLTLFLDRFGPEGLDWDPATRVLEIEEEFDVDLSQQACDKLETAIQILTTDRFHKSLPDFISFCHVLNGDRYHPNTFDPADAEDVAWAMTEGLLISPPEDHETDPFSDEILAYIGGVLDKEGIINAPDILRVALRKARVSPSIGDFSDDPEMFHAIYDVESGKTEDINETIRTKTQILAMQLAALKLQNGNTQKVAQMLRDSVQQK